MRTTPVGFEERKAAQIAAFFTSKAGGEIEKLKLIKLIYLAEREFVSRHGHPMLFDELYSLPEGPICSSCLDGINHHLNKDLWANYLSKKSEKLVGSELSSERDVLDHVSDAEYDVLSSIWESFGFMTAPQLRNYTHKNCPEYVEVEKGKRMPILYRTLFGALGFQDPQECEDRIMDLQRAQNIFAY
jgi:uncharacterized phage-associated protein